MGAAALATATAKHATEQITQPAASLRPAEQIAQSTRCLRATALGEHRAEYLFEQPHGLLLFGTSVTPPTDRYALR